MRKGEREGGREGGRKEGRKEGKKKGRGSKGMCDAILSSILFFPPPLFCPSSKDIEGVISPSQISTALGLSALKNRMWAIFKTSATKGEGLEEAMEW